MLTDRTVIELADPSPIVLDSWHVYDGAGVAVDRHRSRFTAHVRDIFGVGEQESGTAYDHGSAHLPVDGSWFPAFLRTADGLRAAGRVPHAAYLRIDAERTIVSGSPELFLQVDADGHAISAPIEGTRPATGNMTRDAARAAQLVASRNDRAENLMIVDLVRNDSNRVAVPGSTKVTDLYGVRTFPTVIQLVSTIECDLPAGADAVDLVRVAFPPGSMTGAPKERSVTLLGRFEPERRGVYSGSIGLLGIDGAATLSVAIRTIQLTGDRFVLGVGGAITQLSDPEAEWQETVDKAQSMLQAMAVITTPSHIASALGTRQHQPERTTRGRLGDDDRDG